MVNRRVTQLPLEIDGDWTANRRITQVMLEVDIDLPERRATQLFLELDVPSSIASEPPRYTWGIEFDWTNDETWTDESSYVTSLLIDRGRQTPFSAFRTGKLILTLENSSHRFTPWDTGSALYDDVKPHRPVRVRLTYEGQTYHLFRGFLEDIEPMGRLGQEQVKMTCYDGLTSLGNTTVDIAVQQSTTTDAAVGLVLDGIDWPAGTGEGQRDLDTDGDDLDYWWCARDTDARQAIEDVVRSEDGLFFMSDDGKATFIARRNRYSRPAAIRITQADITDIKLDSPWEYIINRAHVTIYPVLVESTAQIYELASQYVAVVPAMFGVTTLWCDFVNSLGQTGAAINVLTPVANTDYTCTRYGGGIGGDMTDYVTIAMTPYSTSAKLVCTNTWYDAVYFSFLQIRGDALLTTPTYLISEDTTSQADYGVREYTYDWIWQQDFNLALLIANSLVNFWKDIRTAVKITLVDRPDITLGLELGDIINFDSDLYSIDTDFMLGHIFIESLGGVSGQQPGMQALKWTYMLEPTPRWALLDEYNWGRLDVDAYLGW